MLRHLIAALLLAFLLFLAASYDVGTQVHAAIVLPPEGYAVQNGNSLHVPVQLTDREGNPVDDASSVTVTVTAPSGSTAATLPCSHRGEGTYANAPHDSPMGSVIGTWSIAVVAHLAGPLD